MSTRAGLGISPASPGAVIAGKYRVERLLGEGSSAIVLEATHMSLDARVAIKLLREDLARDAVVVERFLREARAAAKIRGQHVGRVYDVNALEDGTPYMVMERLEGCDLAALLCAEGALPVATAIDYVLQASEALAQAHAAGIIHRDVKPENFFLVRLTDGSPCIKVVDFGASKQLLAAGITSAAASCGTPVYMSPEQIRTPRDIDARSDIWGLGVTLFELVTAAHPFAGDSLLALCTAILERPTPSARALRPDVPEEIDQVIARCLEKDRNARFANVGAFADALRLVSVGPAPDSCDLSDTSSVPPLPLTRTNWTSVAGIATVIIVLAGVAATTSRTSSVSPDRAELASADPIAPCRDPTADPPPQAIPTIEPAAKSGRSASSTRGAASAAPTMSASVPAIVRRSAPQSGKARPLAPPASEPPPSAAAAPASLPATPPLPDDRK